jgi:antirestriction protein ArdC
MSKQLNANARADIHQGVTNAIIRDLEQGTRRSPPHRQR